MIENKDFEINTNILHINCLDGKTCPKILLNKLIHKIKSLNSIEIDGRTVYFLEKQKKVILSEKEENKLTKWNKFASKKQIKKKSKDSKKIYNEEEKKFIRKSQFYKPKK